MIYAMASVVLLTFIVASIAVTARVKAVKSRAVSLKYFQLMEGDSVPLLVAKTTRNFNNLFEVPVLFYVVASLFVALNIESDTAIILAWAFVLSRYLHSFIHVTYNNVLHRMLAFWASLLCVGGLWLVLLIEYAAK